jgi:hypothetical protein
VASGIAAEAAGSVAEEGLVGVVAAEGMVQRIWPSQWKQLP